MALGAVATQAICAHSAHGVATARPARAAAAVDVRFTRIHPHVAARWRRALRFRTDVSSAVLIGAATRAGRARHAVRTSAVDVRLGSVAKAVATRGGRTGAGFAANAVAVFVEITVVAARATGRSAGFTAVDVRLAPVLEAIGAGWRSTSARQAHAGGAIFGHEAALASFARHAAATTIVVAFVPVLLPVRAVRRSHRRLRHGAVLGE